MDKLNTIFYYLNFLFGQYFIIKAIITIIGLISVVFMCLYSIVLVLFATYRPHLVQYPFNLILDRYIPLIAIFTPTILVLWVNLGKSDMLEKFIYILVSHIFILLPIMYYWSKHRHWMDYTIYDKLSLKRWESPELYLDITVAIIYPSLWGILFFILRYLRLGKEINIQDYFTDNIISLLFMVIISLPLTYDWIKLLLLKLRLFKSFLWTTFSRLVLSLGILLLNNKQIFHVIATIHKLSFMWITFMICHPFLYERTYIRRKIQIIYLKKYKMIVFSLIVLLTELFIMGSQLYYSIYIIAICLTLRPIIMVLDNFCGIGNTWIEYCCNADYINNNWYNPYYPKRFWLSFKEMRENFNNYPLLDYEQEKHINNITTAWEKKRDLTYNRNIYIFDRLVKKSNIKFIYRLRFVYHKWTRTGLE